MLFFVSLWPVFGRFGGPVLAGLLLVLSRFWPVVGWCGAGFSSVWAGFWPVGGRFWRGVEDICPEGRI